MSLGHGIDADPTKARPSRKAVYWPCRVHGCPSLALEGLRYCEAHLDLADFWDRRFGIGGPLPQRRRKPR